MGQTRSFIIGRAGPTLCEPVHWYSSASFGTRKEETPLHSNSCNDRVDIVVLQVRARSLYVGHWMHVGCGRISSKGASKDSASSRGIVRRMALDCLRTQPAASNSQRLTLATFELTWIHTCYAGWRTFANWLTRCRIVRASLQQRAALPITPVRAGSSAIHSHNTSQRPAACLQRRLFASGLAVIATLCDLAPAN